MDTFYSLIYYRPNVMTDELLALGVLASGGEGPFLYISKRRTDLLKKTIHPQTFTALQRRMKSLKKTVDDYRIEHTDLMLFDPHYSREKLEALHSESSGAILYSKTVSINQWLDASQFNELIYQFFGDRATTSKKKRPVFQLRWKAFYQSKHCDSWERNVLLSNICDVDLPMRLDLYRADSKAIAKGLNFDLKPATVKRRIYEIQLLAESLPDHYIYVVHPSPRKDIGKSLLKSMKHTVPHIVTKKFSSFRDNS